MSYRCFDDWGIAQSLFDEIFREGGSYDIDLFACDYSAKVKKIVPDFGISFRFQWTLNLNWTS